MTEASRQQSWCEFHEGQCIRCGQLERELRTGVRFGVMDYRPCTGYPRSLAYVRQIELADSSRGMRALLYALTR